MKSSMLELNESDEDMNDRLLSLNSILSDEYSDTEMEDTDEHYTPGRCNNGHYLVCMMGQPPAYRGVIDVFRCSKCKSIVNYVDKGVWHCESKDAFC